MVKPAIILMGIACIYALVFTFTSAYRRDEHALGWYGWVVMHVIMALVYALFVALFSLTIFLNQFESISSNRMLSGCSWFLLPVAFIFAVSGKAINEYLTVGSTWEIIYALLAGLPFMWGLIAGFIKFRKLVKNTPPEQDNSYD